MISAVLLGVVVLALAAGLMLSARLVSRRPDLAQVAVEGAYLAVRPRGTKNLQAGMFATDNQTGIVFMLVGRGQRFLRVDLGSGKIRYLVIQVSDPDQAAAELTANRRR
ncbi:MAG: hypothetical protein WAK82_31875 [Streptosporangiaceae bacterium]